MHFCKSVCKMFSVFLDSKEACSAKIFFFFGNILTEVQLGALFFIVQVYFGIFYKLLITYIKTKATSGFFCILSLCL